LTTIQSFSPPLCVLQPIFRMSELMEAVMADLIKTYPFGKSGRGLSSCCAPPRMLRTCRNIYPRLRVCRGANACIHSAGSQFVFDSVWFF
jgi:hypothetical protein